MTQLHKCDGVCSGAVLRAIPTEHEARVAAWPDDDEIAWQHITRRTLQSFPWSCRRAAGCIIAGCGDVEGTEWSARRRVQESR